jgi:DNA-damage-inducible protein D
LPENEVAGKKGGGIAKKARLELEEKTGKRIVSGENYLPPKTGKELGGK